jgi:hypothetical protein
MPQVEKGKYTGQQRWQAEQIENGYKAKGASTKIAARA